MDNPRLAPRQAPAGGGAIESALQLTAPFPKPFLLAKPFLPVKPLLPAKQNQGAATELAIALAPPPATAWRGVLPARSASLAADLGPSN